MDADEIAREKAEIIQQHGPWTAHNIRLADGVYTIGPDPTGDEVKLRRVVQLVHDLAGPPQSLRVLDLACLEGMYAIELAARGAETLAIEGRESNVEKARFAARALGLDNVRVELGDVRDLSREQHGEFDVVLCLGILYHLDSEGVFRLVERVGQVCRHVAIFDTWVADVAREHESYRGEQYAGMSLFEHDPDASEADRLSRVWSSLDNPSAFAPTRPSLLRLLAGAGFGSILEAAVPPEPEKPGPRITLAAIRGERQTLRVAPEVPYAFPAEPSSGRRRPDIAEQLARARRLVRRALRRPSKRL